MITFQLDNYLQYTQNGEESDFCLCVCKLNHSITYRNIRVPIDYMPSKCKKSIKKA